jgi:hypothetical protein
MSTPLHWRRMCGSTARFTPNRSKKIRIHKTPCLFGGDSFLQPREVVSGIVNGDVDAAGFGDGGIRRPLDRGVVSDIQFKDVYRQ